MIRERALTVSVIMPAYRVTAYIAQAIDSVLAQTFPAHQIIVINDDCPDTPGLDGVVARYADRILYLKRPNGGPAAARNTGIRAATGDMVAFLDSDDYWAPDFLELQLAHLEDVRADMVYANGVCILSDSGEVRGTLMDATPSVGEPTLEALLRGCCTVLTSGVVVRRALLERAGLFDETVGNYSEDFDLWLRILHSGGRMSYRRETLIYHRVHRDSLTSQPLELPRGALRMLEKARRTLDLTPAELAALEQRVAEISAAINAEEARTLLVGGRYAEAYDRISRAVELGPTPKRRLAKMGLRVSPRLARMALHLRSRIATTPTRPE